MKKQSDTTLRQISKVLQAISGRDKEFVDEFILKFINQNSSIMDRDLQSILSSRREMREQLCSLRGVITTKTDLKRKYPTKLSKLTNSV